MNSYFSSILAEFSPAWLRSRLAKRRILASRPAETPGADSAGFLEHPQERPVRAGTRAYGQPHKNRKRNSQ